MSTSLQFASLFKVKSKFGLLKVLSTSSIVFFSSAVCGGCSKPTRSLAGALNSIKSDEVSWAIKP